MSLYYYHIKAESFLCQLAVVVQHVSFCFFVCFRNDSLVPVQMVVISFMHVLKH